jgi:hypothetical protein
VDAVTLPDEQLARLRENYKKFGPRRGLAETIAESGAIYTLSIRTSPRPLIPFSGLNLTPTPIDPPHTVPGMCDVWVDASGG